MRNRRWAWVVSAASIFCLACSGGVSLAADGDEAADDVREDSGGGTDFGETPVGDVLDDGAVAGCPIFAVPAAAAGVPVDGSREHPYLGLQAALDARGSCGHIVLVQDAAGAAFDAFADVLVTPGERLTIEGDPSGGRRVELSGRGASPGLWATGEGILVLRRLAVRDGVTGLHPGEELHGGCLNAMVERLELEDTEWSGCRADGHGGAVFFVSTAVDTPGGLLVRTSSFRDNAAGSASDYVGGAIAFDSAREDAPVVVQGSSFRGNSAPFGGALALKGLTVALSIEDSWFTENSATKGATAVEGFVGGTIDGCRFERNIGSPGSAALRGALETSSAAVTHNVFLANRTATVDGPCHPCALGIGGSGLLLANNIVVGNRSEIGSDPRYPCMSGAASLGFYFVVHNNVFVDNVGEGGLAHVGGQDFDFRNNIIVGGEGVVGGVSSWGDGVGASSVEYNATWRVPPPAFAGDFALGPGVVEVDCVFRSPEIGDYALLPGSPCIDAGDPATDLADFDGTRGDLGAFGGPLGNWMPLPAEEAP